MNRLLAWVSFDRDLRHHLVEMNEMASALNWRGTNAMGQWASCEALLAVQSWHADALVQPAVRSTSAGEVVVVCDGELYNAKDLRQQLANHRISCSGANESELLLDAYLYWGSEFVNRVNGIFAFAIWDGREKILLLGRDRLGVKPIYFTVINSSIIVASEPKALLAHADCAAKLDYQSLLILLQPRLAMPGETGFVGIRELAPGHIMQYSATGSRSHQYWRLASRQHTDDFPATVDRVAQLLKVAVAGQACHAYGAGSIGAMLSGGLDSTSVLALLMGGLRNRNERETVHSFCLEYEDQESHFIPSELRPDIDAPYAEAAAQEIGSRHHRVQASLKVLAEAERFTRKARDLPAWGQFDASMYALFAQMAKYSRVVITGEIADELFGGYPYCFDEARIAAPDFPWIGDGPKLSDYLADAIQCDIRPREDVVHRYETLLNGMSRLEGEDSREARMREILYLGLAGPTTVLIDRMERMTAANALQIRMPFCDYRLLEYVWNVPWRFKSQGGVKGLLKAAVQEVVPDVTLTRKKSAYPHIQNPAYDRRIIEETNALLRNSNSAISALFDVPKLQALVDQVAAGKITAALPGSSGAAKLLIHLVELEHWIIDNNVSI